MDCTAKRISYKTTGYFSKIVTDYIDQNEGLKNFFTHPPTTAGIEKAIAARQQFKTDRKILVSVLKKQYVGVSTSAAVLENIEALSSDNTFTITTAHQSNLFTGPLYFIYKIFHAIKLSGTLKQQLPQYNFVPVFYMGSEDADLDELNHIYLGGQKLEWKTKQTGAVGRMKIDKELLKLIDLMEGQLLVQPYGREIMQLARDCYKPGEDIQTATFKLLNTLFAEFGLIVLLPDNADLKKQMIKVFEDDLFQQNASAIVERTSAELGKSYKVQAHPREINLFYLKDDIRERIVKTNSEFRISNSELKFSKTEILDELQQHPERFSPNVILRGLYQETTLPNIAFIGGGGELAYWLELKDLFVHYKVPFPVLVLRNSFLLVEKKWQEKISKLQFNIEDFFLPEEELLNRLVKRESDKELHLNGSFSDAQKLYENIGEQAAKIDATLSEHVSALKEKSLYRLQELEKKMIRAEKRKFADSQRQIHTIKQALFPADGLQERYDNLNYYYAKWGSSFLQKLYEHSLALEQEFIILAEK